MIPRAKLFISTPDCEGVFGEGKFQLLRAVGDHGSISKAAVALGRSYRKAWGDIKRAEEALGRSLIVKTRGGSAGGRSALTDYCTKLLHAWEKHRRLVYSTLDRSYTQHLENLLGPLEPPGKLRRGERS